VVREAPFVVRLAYTRSQAAEALGVSRSTFVRRILPYVETIEIPSGSRLIPVDELERFVRERRRTAVKRAAPTVRRSGRPSEAAPEVVSRICEARGCGQSFAEIARVLTEDGVPTAHGGRRWWPSTVRGIAARARG
jgi:hypothetical protein